MSKRIAWNKGKKEQIKHYYYTDGIKNIRIPFDQDPPDGFHRGRVVKWSEETRKQKAQKTYQTKLERYGDPNYNNMDKTRETKFENFGDENYNNSEKTKQTCLQKYGVDNVSKVTQIKEKISENLKGHAVSNETKNKISIARTGSKLSPEMCAIKTQKTIETCRKRGLFKRRKTNPEIYVENLLSNRFGKENVIYNYSDSIRYSFACDFYVKSEDLFIEVHAGWRHNIKPFDNTDEYCLNELAILEEKAKTSDNYKNAVFQWTEHDVRKLKVAISSNINYIMIYPDNIYIVSEKPRELLENLLSWYQKEDNQQPSFYLLEEGSTTIESISWEKVSRE